MREGTISIRIAQVFLILQILFVVGTLGAGSSRDEPKAVAFHDAYETLASVVFLGGINIAGIGALALSLIAWKYHKNAHGKNTALISAIVIVVNSLLQSA